MNFRYPVLLKCLNFWFFQKHSHPNQFKLILIFVIFVIQFCTILKQKYLSGLHSFVKPPIAQFKSAPPEAVKPPFGATLKSYY